MPSNPNKPYEIRNISRIDNRSKRWNTENHGWQVRYRRGNRKISQWFEDGLHGGKDNALKEAKQYRDIMERELRLEPKGKITRKHVTVEDPVGVYRIIRHLNYKSGPHEYPIWVANWPKGDGKKDRKAFAVEKFGEQEAQRLAIEARNEGTRKYYEQIDEQQIYPVFKPPTEPNIKIWRYMDFTKFVAMLQNTGLFLSRIDTLEDAFEGSFSKVNKLLRPLIYKHKSISQECLSNLIMELRKRVVVSCWHMNEQESAAMWNLYAKSEEAICIQSTYARLRRNLSDTMRIGIVQYVDYEKYWIEEFEPLLPFLYKRKSFEHEREIRIICNLSGVDRIVEGYKLKESPEDGIWANLQLSDIVEKVFIAPQADEWFRTLVEKEAKKYGLDITVQKSSLEAEPFF
jgi:hypothetical protein